MDGTPSRQRGYLQGAFRLFHLKDMAMQPVDWHFHDFHKLLILLAGRISYDIEGRTYNLEPGDVVLVCRGCLHRPRVDPGTAYERMIIYVDPQFLREAGDACNLEQVFLQAAEESRCALRAGSRFPEMMTLLARLEREVDTPAFGRELLCRSLMVELMIELTRAMEGQEPHYAPSADRDAKILPLLRYLNLHLCDAPGIDALAAQFYMSKYHMMRRFKAATGYTIHGYLTEKRLMMARKLLAAGESPGTACRSCGFGDYSSFSRAYRRRFGRSPGDPDPAPELLPEQPE